MGRKRRPFPYAAGAALKDALQANAEALNELRVMINTPGTTEEKYRRAALAVDAIHNSSAKIREALNTRDDEKGSEKDD